MVFKYSVLITHFSFHLDPISPFFSVLTKKETSVRLVLTQAQNLRNCAQVATENHSFPEMLGDSVTPVGCFMVTSPFNGHRRDAMFLRTRKAERVSDLLGHEMAVRVMKRSLKETFF